MKTYICEECKQEFAVMWSDEDALAEYDEAFPQHSRGEEMVRVCDACYQILMAQWAAMNQ